VLVVRLFSDLVHAGLGAGRWGLAAAAVAGGMGTAAILETT
jgi:hypothetical protein